jgi:hypothetical protein
MARIGIVKQAAGNSGKAASRQQTPRARFARSSSKAPTPNLSNTYGIRGSSRINLAAPGGLKGAVTQGAPKNKFSLGKFKNKIRGN